MIWKFQRLYVGGGWKDDVFIETGEDGRIKAVFDHAIANLEIDQSVDGISFPAVPNAHSHAFQYAMAGMAEFFGGGANRDDFWSWRQLMYKLALDLSPDDLEAIASAAYLQMLKGGYGSVVEFHYLHKDKDGSYYAPAIKVSEALVRAAQRVGIEMLLVPVYYRLGNFGDDACERQKRFIFKDVEEYLRFVSELQLQYKLTPGIEIGVGVHSLRAASTDEISDIIRTNAGRYPFHMHIAEQAKEVRDAEKFIGQRPVEWMLKEHADQKNINLVHATHVNSSEVVGLAQSEMNVVICPTTEANLGDGIFPLRKYCEAGGRFSIGSDSHVGLDFFRELCLLDYGQRLKSNRRDEACLGNIENVGEELYRSARVNGQFSMGRPGAVALEVGEFLNVCSITKPGPFLEVGSAQTYFNTMIYAPNSAAIDQVVSLGKLQIKSGAHLEEEEIREAFAKVLHEKKIRLHAEA